VGAHLALVERDEEASEEYRKALSLSESLAKSHSSDKDLQGDVESTYYFISDIRRKQGRMIEATEACERATALGVERCGRGAGDRRSGRHLASTFQKLGLLRAAVGRTAEAIEIQQRAVAIRERLSSAEPTDDGLQAELASALHYLGMTHRGAGQAADALNAFRKARTILERLREPNATNLYNLACEWALCGEILGQRSERLTAAEDAERRESAGRAMAALHHAVAAGFGDAAHLRSDSDLVLLRTRPDFQLLLSDLVFPRFPFVGGQFEQPAQAR
jgi:tetratricopeptide (TPR) repeat protein